MSTAFQTGTPTAATIERSVSSLAQGAQGGYNVVASVTCRAFACVLLQTPSERFVMDTFGVSSAQVRVVYCDPITDESGINAVRPADMLLLNSQKYEVMGVSDYAPIYVAIYVRIPSQ